MKVCEQTASFGAGVGRSTFYEHFRNKDDVLRHSASNILAILANAVTDEDNFCRVRMVVDHILDQKTIAKPLLAGPGGVALTVELAKLIEARLATRVVGDCAEPVVPMQFVSRQVAEAQMALLRSWLDDSARCSATDLATAICRSSRGLVNSLECESITVG